MTHANQEKPRVPELLPCPFCGQEAEIFSSHSSRDGSLLFRVMCDQGLSCQTVASTMRMSSEEAAIEAWNTRTPDLTHALQLAREENERLGKAYAAQIKSSSETIETLQSMADRRLDRLVIIGAQLIAHEAAWIAVRDCVLNERYQMAEGGFTSDQVNAVLGIIDDYAPQPGSEQGEGDEQRA